MVKISRESEKGTVGTPQSKEEVLGFRMRYCTPSGVSYERCCGLAKECKEIDVWGRGRLRNY